MRIYLETTALAALTYFRNIEKDRCNSVSKLLEICKKQRIVLIVSFYALHEIFLLAFDYFDKTTARKIGKHFVMHQSKFKMKDRTDIPHAISAFVENCNYIITYDTHFDHISHLVRVSTPEELISELMRTEK